MVFLFRQDYMGLPFRRVGHCLQKILNSENRHQYRVWQWPTLLDGSLIEAFINGTSIKLTSPLLTWTNNPTLRKPLEKERLSIWTKLKNSHELDRSPSYAIFKKGAKHSCKNFKLRTLSGRMIYVRRSSSRRLLRYQAKNLIMSCSHLTASTLALSSLQILHFLLHLPFLIFCLCQFSRNELS